VSDLEFDIQVSRPRTAILHEIAALLDGYGKSPAPI